jgi:[ribosomal protein S5]-alanine N-acetyltransferase
MRLAGPTLALRPPDTADADALFALGADAEVTRWFSWGPYASVAEPSAWIAEQVGRRARGEALALVVEHPEAGVIGVTDLVEWSPRDRRAMIGTWLGRAWWGTGVNATSKRLVLALAFEHCGVQRVGAYADVANVRSQRSLLRAGFNREGTLRHWHRHGDVEKDVAVFGLLRAEWAAHPATGAVLDGEVPPAFRVG